MKAIHVFIIVSLAVIALVLFFNETDDGNRIIETKQRKIQKSLDIKRVYSAMDSVYYEANRIYGDPSFPSKDKAAKVRYIASKTSAIDTRNCPTDFQMAVNDFAISLGNGASWYEKNSGYFTATIGIIFDRSKIEKEAMDCDRNITDSYNRMKSIGNRYINEAY